MLTEHIPNAMQSRWTTDVPEGVDAVKSRRQGPSNTGASFGAAGDQLLKVGSVALPALSLMVTVCFCAYAWKFKRDAANAHTRLVNAQLAHEQYQDASEKLQGKIIHYETELNGLNNSCVEKRAELTRLKDEVQAQRDLDESRKLRGEIAHCEAKLEILQTNCAEKQAELAQLEEKVRAQQESLVELTSEFDWEDATSQATSVATTAQMNQSTDDLKETLSGIKRELKKEKNKTKSVYYKISGLKEMTNKEQNRRKEN